MRSSVPVGRAAWTRIVAGFERAGLGQAKFCEERGLNLGTFRTWLYRLRGERAEQNERMGPRLLELVAVPEKEPDSVCVVRSGTSEVRFSQLPEVGYLGALLRVVEGR